MTIRAANESDIPALLSIERDVFSENPWTASQFQYELNKNPYASLAVYEENDQIIGMIDWWIMYENADIANIGVLKEYWHKGIGSKLLEYAINTIDQAGCEAIHLEVRVSNTAAISLYEKHGFIQVGIRKRYYENGEDAYRMIKPLGGNWHDEDIGN